MLTAWQVVLIMQLVNRRCAAVSAHVSRLLTWQPPPHHQEPYMDHNHVLSVLFVLYHVLHVQIQQQKEA
jgi:hypothetical protein